MCWHTFKHWTKWKTCCAVVCAVLIAPYAMIQAKVFAFRTHHRRADGTGFHRVYCWIWNHGHIARLRLVCSRHTSWHTGQTLWGDRQFHFKGTIVNLAWQAETFSWNPINLPWMSPDQMNGVPRVVEGCTFGRRHSAAGITVILGFPCLGRH